MLAVARGADHADRRWLVSCFVDDGRGSYYVWNRRAGGGNLSLSQSAGALGLPAGAHGALRVLGQAMGSRSRLLHIPVGAARERRPTVLCVHGGPWHRDVWGYSVEAQFLANWGYLCAQVNFRGSTG